MPVVLPWDECDLWSDLEFQDRDKHLSMLRTLPADEMTMRTVSQFVNNAQNQGEVCVALA